ncbi:hypothetical protein [Stenomitos frigidus]|nr:hypothetical protein [Stenomitos frigidus]
MTKPMLTKSRIVAIALTAFFAPSTMPQPAQANPMAARAAMAACYAQPEACAVVLATAGAWVLWRNGPKLWCTPGQCVPTRKAPRELRTDRQPDDSGKQATTGRLVKNYDGCRDMEKRFRQGGFKLRLVRIERNRSRGTLYDWWCVFGGDSREVARFDRYWR